MGACFTIRLSIDGPRISGMSEEIDVSEEVKDEAEISGADPERLQVAVNTMSGSKERPPTPEEVAKSTGTDVELLHRARSAAENRCNDIDELSETRNPWAYLDDYKLTGNPEYIRSADQHRQSLLDEIDWMVATGQNGAVGRFAAFARQINQVRGE